MVVLQPVQGAGQQEAAIAALRKVIDRETPFIVLQDYQNRGARIVGKDVITVDANPLIRYRIVSAVAVAAGRASPQIRSETDAVAFTSAPAAASFLRAADEQGVGPSVREALRDRVVAACVGPVCAVSVVA